jgi:hypothetical protein
MPERSISSATKLTQRSKPQRFDPLITPEQAGQTLAEPSGNATTTQTKSLPSEADESTETASLTAPAKALKVKQAKKTAKKKKLAAKPAPISAEARFFQVPGPECLTPRDGKTIERTDDYLFIAVLIERSRPTGWVKAERNPESAPQFILFAPPPEIIKGKTHPHLYATKTLRKILVRNRDLWILRTYLQNPTAPSLNITIDGHIICSEGKWHSNAFTKRRPSLRHPIAMGQPDELLTNLHAQRFYSWCDLTQPEPCTLTGQPPEPPNLPPNTLKNRKKRERLLSKWRNRKDTYDHFQLICPLDGPVTPMTVGMASPASTWKDLCGRAYNSLHCPHCLARLHSKLAFKN